MAIIYMMLGLLSGLIVGIMLLGEPPRTMR
jgi:hypothetical protein